MLAGSQRLWNGIISSVCSFILRSLENPDSNCLPIFVQSNMLTKRITACLDVHGDRVVKGVQFANLRDAGDPAELAKAHSQSGADEIVLLDISASYERRATLLETVRRT